MARARRKSGRANAAGSPEPVAEENNSETSPPGSQGTTAAAGDAAPQEEDKCPACKEATQEDWRAEDKESWVRCDACKTWFHWRCAGQGDLEAIGKWCALVRVAACVRVVVYKPVFCVGFVSRVVTRILRGLLP